MIVDVPPADSEWTVWRDRFNNGEIAVAMRESSRGLNRIKHAATADRWREIIRVPRMQTLREIAHECPYTRRGFEKPRGYAGDAVLLDYIYDSAPMPDGTTARGRDILRRMRQESEGFASVRWWRDYFAELLDATASKYSAPRVANRLRSLSRGAAIASGQIRAFDKIYALDQDAHSLEVVEADQAADGVTCVHAPVRDLITGKISLKDLHLVYVAGLYDYMADAFARKLTAQLFRSLTTGGSLVIANFVHMWEDGWMEAFMDWWLIYRRSEELCALADEIDHSMIANSQVFTDPSGNVAYLELIRG